MAYKTLMVYFDGTPGALARLRLAVDLADRFRATLIGIAGPPYLPPSELGMEDSLARIEKEFRGVAKRVKMWSGAGSQFGRTCWFRRKQELQICS